MGNIILIDYKSSTASCMSEIRSKLENAWNMLHIKTEDMMQKQQQQQNIVPMKNEIKDVYLKYNTPILIYVIIELNNNNNNRTTTTNKNDDDDNNGSSASGISRYQEYIQNAVNEVHQITSSIIQSTHKVTYHFNRNFTRNWYVQPLSHHKSDYHLRHGFFSGLNWLLRASRRQHAELLCFASRSYIMKKIHSRMISKLQLDVII